MERIYTIGTFTFKLIYDEKLIKIPPNFQIFESQEEPEYTYEFIVSETLPQIEGRVVSQRDELLILDCDGLETRYLGVKGSDWYYGVYQELTPHSARSIILKDTLGELYVDPFFCSFFSLEKKLLEKDALVLHCSYMQYKDYAILFSAPSGTGKTTQATLWEEYKGSHVVNGDKGLLMKDDGVWTAHGWPVCGSSGVCHNKNVPIKCVVMLCMCIVLGSGYLVYESYYTIDVTQYTMKSDKIHSPVNIVMIADVHDNHTKIKKQVINKIKKLKPDLIMCVGDIIDNESKSDQSTLDFLHSLVGIAPVYMSYGNHELEYYSHHAFQIENIKSTGVHFLDESYEDITVKGNSIRVGGLYDYAFSNEDGGISKKSMHNNHVYRYLSTFNKTDSYRIMLCHRPDTFIYADAYMWNVGLILSGHVHGGQIILPNGKGLYAPEQGWFPEYDYGLYRLGINNMIITRGVSSSGEALPRMNNPAEIVQITLR